MLLIKGKKRGHWKIPHKIKKFFPFGPENLQSYLSHNLKPWPHTISTDHPASSSHLQLQGAQGQRPSRGRGIFDFFILFQHLRYNIPLTKNGAPVTSVIQ
jgi:hypothetical protein